MYGGRTTPLAALPLPNFVIFVGASPKGRPAPGVHAPDVRAKFFFGLPTARNQANQAPFLSSLFCTSRKPQPRLLCFYSSFFSESNASSQLSGEKK